MQVAEIPRTLTGKKQELPVKKLMLGRALAEVVNPDACANPAAFDWFAAYAQRRAQDLNPSEEHAMQRLLEGKVALVTGGGRGIGRAIALGLAQAGAKVVVNDLGARSTATAPTPSSRRSRSCAQIEAAGGQAVVDGGSVADWNAAHKMVAAAVDTFGRIDIVVNNAGILRDVMFHRMSEADFDAVVAVHLKGSFNVSRAAAPHFKGQGSGCYVHMTSTSGLIGNFGQANYSAAKLGIAALSKSIALDMQKFGVRSNAVAPFAWTPDDRFDPGRDDPSRRGASRG